MPRKIILIGFFIVSFFTAKNSLAQSPNIPSGIIFQALATDPNGNPAAGRSIYIKSTIIQKSVSGQAVYAETFSVNASNDGVFTITIGKGKLIAGFNPFNSIDWTNGPYFLTLKRL